MNGKETGGAAFPNIGARDGSLYPELGMTLRDWFAGHEKAEEISIALAEKLTGRQHPKPEDGKGADYLVVAKFWAEAEAAYRYMKADAMIAERSK